MPLPIELPEVFFLRERACWSSGGAMAFRFRFGFEARAAGE